MTKDYSKTANTALKLITKFGVASEFLRDESVVNPDPYNPPLAPVTVSYPTQAVKVPASAKDVVFLPEGTSINKTAKILMEAVEMVEIPTIGDKVRHAGVDWQIIAVKPLQPADVNVMWTVYVNI